MSIFVNILSLEALHLISDVVTRLLFYQVYSYIYYLFLSVYYWFFFSCCNCVGQHVGHDSGHLYHGAKITQTSSQCRRETLKRRVFSFCLKVFSDRLLFSSRPSETKTPLFGWRMHSGKLLGQWSWKLLATELVAIETNWRQYSGEQFGLSLAKNWILIFLPSYMISHYLKTDAIDKWDSCLLACMIHHTVCTDCY